MPLDVFDDNDRVVDDDATASTRPNRDRLLSDTPKTARIVNVPISETGIATTGMIVARQFCRNRNTTATTRRIATKIVTTTS